MATSTTANNNNNVLLFKYSVNNPRLFLILSTAAGIQFIFWSYLSFTALTDYTKWSNNSKTVNSKEQTTDNTTRGKIIEKLKEKSKSLKWRLGLSALAMSLGTFFSFTSFLYPLRTVHKMSYNVSSRTIQLCTYTPLGRIRCNELPSSLVLRTGNAQSLQTPQLPLKVKDHSLYYLLDKRGTFPNRKSFDMIIARKN